MIKIGDFEVSVRPETSTDSTLDQQPGGTQARDAAREAQDTAEHPKPIETSESTSAENKAEEDVETSIAEARADIKNRNLPGPRRVDLT